MRLNVGLVSVLMSVVTIVSAEMMDMTHILNKHTMHPPMVKNFSKTLSFNDTFPGAKGWWRANDLNFNEHTGTHMDAPGHSVIGKRLLHQLPLKQLVGPAVVFDVREKAKNEIDYGLSISDINEYEMAHGRIPDGAIALVCTGGSEVYNNARKYLGSEKPWDFFSMHFPGFTEESTGWLIKNRKIKGIGADRLSFEAGKTHTFPVHYLIAMNEVYGLENVANIHKIPVKGAVLVVLPAPVEDGTGFPTRIVAFWGNNRDLNIFSGSPVNRGVPVIIATFSALVNIIIGLI